MEPCIARLCILYNQRDATYTTFFIIISAVHVSGGFFRQSSGVYKNFTCSVGYCQAFLLSTAGVDGMEVDVGEKTENI